MFNKKIISTVYTLIALVIILIGFVTAHNALAQTALSTIPKVASKSEKAAEKPVTPTGPADEYNRGNPRSSLRGYFKATRDGNFKQAAQYLDMRNLPVWMADIEASELARQLIIVLHRKMWVDLDLISAESEGNRQDGLHTKLESIGRIKTPTRTIDIIMQRVPREDGVYIWKFSNRTVAEIPDLYRQFGYKPFERKLSRLFPDFTFLTDEN